MTPYGTLLECPKDIKESIDWLLRVSGKDTGGYDRSDKLLTSLQVLLKHPDVNDLKSTITNLASKFHDFATWLKKDYYTYSYSSNASWENLCKWHPYARCCTDKSGCEKCKIGRCDGSCCDHCELIKCAKIFVGIIPCLFSGLNYLCIMCQGEWKDKYTWESNFNAFLGSIGYPYQYHLDSFIGGDMGKRLEPAVTLLKTIDKCVSGHFSRFHRTTQPTTIRDMLQWFSVFPLRPAFESLLEYCDSECKNISNRVNTVNAEDLKLNLRSFCFLCPTILMTIECPDGSDSPFWYDLHNEAWQLYIPVNDSTLFETVNDYIYTLYVHLNFLYNQCIRENNQGGWQRCKYGRYSTGKATAGQSNHANQRCDCPEASDYLCTHLYYPYHYLGYNYLGYYYNGYHSEDNDCPSPLRKFLMDQNSHFKHTIKMGFKLSEKSHEQVGDDICNALKSLVGPVHDPLLTKLCKYLIFISRRPPESLGDLFAFFYNLPTKWNGNYSKSIKKSIESYIEDAPGTYEGNKITEAVEKLKDHKGEHSNGWHSKKGDLQSLYGCDNNNYYYSCGHYLRPLIFEAYDLYDEKLASMYVSWIVYLAPQFYSLLEKLKGEFEKCSTCGQSGNSWEYLYSCPCALPTLYSYGFTFNDPSQFHSKRCTDIIEQLKTVLGDSAPLKELIQECDEFLWSIRQMFLFPLCIAWARVILQLIYMFIFQLDITRFGSHLFSKSSKESPATLFTTKRIKVSKVSYFHY